MSWNINATGNSPWSRYSFGASTTQATNPWAPSTSVYAPQPAPALPVFSTPSVVGLQPSPYQFATTPMPAASPLTPAPNTIQQTPPTPVTSPITPLQPTNTGGAPSNNNEYWTLPVYNQTGLVATQETTHQEELVASTGIGSKYGAPSVFWNTLGEPKWHQTESTGAWDTWVTAEPNRWYTEPIG